MWTVLLCLVVASMGAVYTMGADAPSGADPTPAFEAAPCWSPRAATAAVRCGYLTVPESREHPNGRSIRVAVAILTPEDTPQGALPSPLVHLTGGPGYATGLDGDMFDYWVDWYRGWQGAAGRSLILVDQRGTGLSEPRLQCDAGARRTALLAYYGRPTSRNVAEDVTFSAAHLQACRAPFTAKGIDVTAYNSAENAADFAALRQALGIAQWDVWGISYGTELALELLRIDEAGIRSMILDSVSLYQHPAVVPGNVAGAFDRAMMTIFRDCLLNEACRAAFPALQTGFGQRMAWLNLAPHDLALPAGFGWDDASYVLDGRRVAELLFVGLYSAEMVPAVPATVFGLHFGHYEPLGYLAAGQLTVFADDMQSELAMASTQCRAAPRGDALARLRDQEGRHPNYAALWTAPYLEAVCADWGSAPAQSAETEPVHSDVPALVLAGRYDPITPPEWGQIVAGWLPNSRFLEFPHLTHGSVGVDSCADEIAAGFLDRPEQDPRGGCFADLAQPSFFAP